VFFLWLSPSALNMSDAPLNMSGSLTPQQEDSLQGL
jgi:hypothetical protein